MSGSRGRWRLGISALRAEISYARRSNEDLAPRLRRLSQGAVLLSGEWKDCGYRLKRPSAQRIRLSIVCHHHEVLHEVEPYICLYLFHLLS